MKQGGFFRRTLVLVYGTVLLFAVLIIGIYTAISPQLFARNKIDDLIPKGQIISGYIESTLRGEISTAYLVPLIGRSTAQWEATVWVVDSQGDTLIRTQQEDGRRVGRLPTRLATAMLPTVMTGSVATHIGDQEDLKAPALHSRSASLRTGILDNIAGQGDQSGAESEEVMSGSIVAVAVPITFFGEVVGAVFMAQTMNEVMSGMQALSDTITFSLLLVALLLLPVVLYFASRITRPLADMRAAALTMAGGDLAARADERRPDEFGELGRALNFLSSELGSTISSLEMERNRLQSLIHDLAEGIIALDAKGEVTLSNPAAYTLLQLQGDACVRAGAPSVLSVFDESLQSAATVRRTIWQGSTALHIVVSPLVRADGEITGCVGVLSDVTSAERLEQTRRDYVANVSHELRTPLTAMRAMLEPLRDGLIRTEEQRQQTYDIVLRETMRLSRLVSDMLELSRLQSSKASLARSVFAPGPLFEVIRETYSAYAEDYQQTFIYDVPDTLPRVTGNPDRTQQVLIALLDNAFKYSREDGFVTLSVQDCGDLLRVTVRDTGIGISPQDLPHVFDRFYKADKSHGGKGTGLGLAIAYEIMKQLGEEMTVDSTLGEGSAFTFTLHTAKEAPVCLPERTAAPL